MSEGVIAALITALGGTVTYMLGAIYTDKKLPMGMKKEVVRDQIFFVYEPIAVILESRTVLLNQTPLKETIQNIMEEHYSLISPNLLCLFRSILATDVCLKEIFDLELMISSNYNWSKKKLGYPYDEKAIDPSLLFFYERRQSKIKYFKELLYWIGLTCSLSSSTALITIRLADIQVSEPVITALYAGLMFTGGYVGDALSRLAVIQVKKIEEKKQKQSNKDNKSTQ